jgi:uncharacterized damage-inducible protein DinB
MLLKDAFISEIKYEYSLAKKMLEKVPMDKKDWKPHEKSMSLGRLATHVAEISKWASNIIHIDDFDFLKDFRPGIAVASSPDELLQLFQTNLDKAIEDLSTMSDDDFNKIWTVRRGDYIVLQAPKKVAIRGWTISHMIHHRGQLSVYLRLLDVPVPGMYGPSADEK